MTARLTCLCTLICATTLPTLSMSNPWLYDSFLLDDYSMDPTTAGFSPAPPPTSATSDISQYLDIRNDDLPGASFTRLHTAVSAPASEFVALNLDVMLDMRWPLTEGQWQDAPADSRITAERLTLDVETDDFNLRAGHQSISWGVIPGAGVLDVASAYRLNIDESIQRERIPTTAGYVEAFWQDFSVTAFFIPAPQQSQPFPALWHDQPPHTTPLDIQMSPAGGFSVHSQGPRAEFGLYSAVLAPDQATVVDQEITADPYWLLGSSLSYDLGRIKADLELAFKSGLRPSPQATTAEPAPDASNGRIDRLDAGVGLNINNTPYGHWSAHLTFRRWLTDQDLTNINVEKSEMAIAWQNQFLDSHLTTSLTAYSSIFEPELIAVGKAEYRWTEHWSTSMQVTQFAAAEDTAFADQNGHTNWLANVSYEF